MITSQSQKSPAAMPGFSAWRHSIAKGKGIDRSGSVQMWLVVCSMWRSSMIRFDIAQMPLNEGRQASMR
jgi:hypothetical protein